MGEDHYGFNKTDLEILADVDRDWLASKGTKVFFLNARGEFVLKRHRLNKRGEASAVDQRKQRVQSVGVIQDRTRTNATCN